MCVSIFFFANVGMDGQDLRRWRFGTDIALRATEAVVVLAAREGRHGSAEQVDTLHGVKEGIAMG